MSRLLLRLLQSRWFVLAFVAAAAGAGVAFHIRSGFGPDLSSYPSAPPAEPAAAVDPEALLRGLAPIDRIDALVDGILRQGAGAQESELLTALLRRRMETDPAGTLALAERVNAGGAGIRLGLLATTWCHVDPVAALEWASLHPEQVEHLSPQEFDTFTDAALAGTDYRYSAAFFENTFPKPSASKPKSLSWGDAQEIDRSLSTIAADPGSSEMLRGFIAMLARSGADSLTAWIRNANLPDAEKAALTECVLFNLAGNRAHPGIVNGWARGLAPWGSAESQVASLSGLLKSAPEDALPMVDSLPNPADRTRLLVAAALNQTSATNAAACIERLPWPTGDARFAGVYALAEKRLAQSGVAPAQIAQFIAASSKLTPEQRRALQKTTD